jgi:hypothetical protein
MVIEIFANKFFDILVAGGIILLITSLSSDNSMASSQGWSLIALGFVGFFLYTIIRGGIRR